jgi:hypothetical protein
MDYKIVETGANLKEIEAKVNDLIKEGWKPQGGICYSSGHYFQAMIKEK